MTLRRTYMKRGQGFMPHVFPLDPKNCTVCDRLFVPNRPLQGVCSQRCAMKKVRAAKAAEKASDKRRKEALKSITEWEQECKAIVQKMARIRDRHDGCISCHVGANYGGRWHGSHYRPAGNNAAVQLNLWNIHKSCAQCNLFKAGNLTQYRTRLVEKIGLPKVEWLESQNQPIKQDAAYLAYLKRFKSVMGKRLRRMEKRV